MIDCGASPDFIELLTFAITFSLKAEYSDFDIVSLTLAASSAVKGELEQNKNQLLINY